MSDERFDLDLRATVAQLMDVRAPRSLRADVDEVLAGQVDLRRYRRAPAWLRFGVAAAAVTGVVAVVAFGLLRVPEGQTAAPSGPTIDATPAATATASAGRPGPTYPTDWTQRVGVPVIEVPPSAVRSITYDFGSDGPLRSGSPAAGPFLYQTSDNTPGRLNVIDIGAGSVTQFAPPLLTDEHVARTRSDGQWLVVEAVEWPTAECTPSEPFRILVTKLGSDGLPDQASGFRVVASGSMPQYSPTPSDKTSCVYIRPVLDLAAGRFAWADAPVVGETSSTIHVVTLDQSAADTSIKASHSVVNLVMSDTSIAWIESRDVDAALVGYAAVANQYPKTQFDWRVMEASLADLTARSVDIGESASAEHPYAPQIDLDGSAVVATRYGPIASTNDRLVTSVVLVDSDSITVIDAGGPDRSCVAGGAADGVVAMQCDFPKIPVPIGGTVGSGMPDLMLPGVWTPSGGLHLVVDNLATPDQGWSAWATPGWLLVMGGNGTSSISIYRAYPLGLLAP